MPRRYKLLILGAIITGLTWSVPLLSALKVSPDRPDKEAVIPSRNHPFWWAQIDFTKAHGVPWSDSDFARLARDGMNGVEINMDWADIEPQRGRFDFRLLDRYMAEAAKAHLKLYLLFWESLWGQKQGKNPPPWITERDVASGGIPAMEPPWWDERSRRAYFDYMARTIDHVKNNPGFGGVYGSYGWLDSEWGAAPKGSHGVTGYATADIQAYYRWLPREYKTIGNLNRQWHTSYARWSDVPVPRPGDPLFPLYQQFRQYSVEEAFDAFSRLIRQHTDAPLLYSWGGGISGSIGPSVQGNDPDTFFRIAKKYHAIVNLDDVDTTGFALLFGSLARSYGVPLLNEWTPWRKGQELEIPQWLGHIGLAAPYEVGEDFFIYPPPAQRIYIAEGWKAYKEWRSTLVKVIRGRVPEQPVAVIVPMRKVSLSADLNPYPDLPQQLSDFWRHYRVLPHFVTDEQVLRGIVRLDQFRAVVDLGNEIGTLPALKAYAAAHPVLKRLDQALPYLRPYAEVVPAYDPLEIVPTVEGRNVWLTLANCNETQSYNGTIVFDPAAVGLHSAGAFSVEDAKTGRQIQADRSAEGKIEWKVSLPHAGFQVIELKL